ncbi:AI-2E family transporter [Chloroflexota bacterium]
MYTARNVFRRHWQLITLILGIIVVFCLLYALRSAIFPFVLGLVLAYLLMPVISWTERKLPRKGRWLQAKRVSLILIIFIVILGLVALFSFYIFTAVIEAFQVLVNNAPAYIAWAVFRLQQGAESLQQQFPPEMQQEVSEFLQEAGASLGNAVRATFLKGVSLIPATFGLAFGLAALPLFLFYILKDSEKLNRGFYSAFSPRMAEHVKNIVSIIERILGRYIRAQLLLGFIVGYLVFIGLLIMRIPFSPALAAFAAVTEFIPILGPWMGGAAAVIVTLAIAPGKALWVALLFLVVQLLENSLLVPRIQAAYLRIHPAVVIVLLVLGAYVAGFWGLILAVPLTATLVEIYRYVRHSIEAEENTVPSPAAD